jgi:uncharacterized protein YbjT (DUF2867 family)
MAPAGRTRAVLIGATGLVGSALLRLLLDDDRVASVAVLGRRATGAAHPKLAEHLVDFDAPAAWAERVAGDVLFSALGTTLRAAGSAAAQYRVDHDYQLRAAEAARRNGVPAYVLVSASGSSPRALVFYSRMKGELERDVEALRFERTRILRPGLLDGERKEKRPGEGWALRVARPLAPLLPASARPIRVEVVARAALAAAFDPAPGLVRYEGRALFALGEGGRA